MFSKEVDKSEKQAAIFRITRISLLFSLSSSRIIQNLKEKNYMGLWNHRVL